MSCASRASRIETRCEGEGLYRFILRSEPVAPKPLPTYQERIREAERKAMPLLLPGIDPEERKAILRGQFALILGRASLGLPTDEAVANLLRVAA